MSIDGTLEFWSGLGFAITYRQRAPNPYGVVKRDGYELHFFGLKGLDRTPYTSVSVDSFEPAQPSFYTIDFWSAGTRAGERDVECLRRRHVERHSLAASG